VALCIRITYVGELGYELYVPSEQAVSVFDTLLAAGEPFNLRLAGLKALSSLRMEKGYRDYGHDIDNTDNVWEVGLGFAVDLDRPFIGRDAAAAQQAAGRPTQRLVQILVSDPEPLMHHAEIVYRDDIAVGYIRAASYGFSLGGAVGLAMVEASEPITQAYLDEGTWEVDIAGTRHSARASLKPLYDPSAERIKA
ncbi:MAG: aminomethyl transferase family protein, partial [bacterium]|nr:aminomethyl transferase family protein [bacterium]